MINCRLAFITVYMAFCAVAYAHKMVILVSTPRSLSTLFLRMMSARGDFEVYNEPGMATFQRFIVEKSPLDDLCPDAIPTFDTLVQQLVRARQADNIFVKEMFFAAREYLATDIFLKNKDCYFVFLVRNPHHASLSLFKKLCVATGDPQALWDIQRTIPGYMDYASLYAMYQEIRGRASNEPLVVIAEEFAACPRETVERVFEQLSIPMRETCFSWEALDEHQASAVWHDSKKPSSTALWHDRAMKSTQFEQLPTYSLDDQGNPTFEEIGDVALRGAHRWEWLVNQSYYRKFIALFREQCSLAQ